jgi:hypothetical protein
MRFSLPYAALLLAVVAGCATQPPEPLRSAQAWRHEARLAQLGTPPHAWPRREPAARTRRPPPPRRPRYLPWGYHPGPRAHVVYRDEEIGENIVGTRYRRIVELFGQPLREWRTSGGRCVTYRVLGRPPMRWEWCFRHGRLDSARGIFGGQPR